MPGADYYEAVRHESPERLHARPARVLHDRETRAQGLDYNSTLVFTSGWCRPMRSKLLVLLICAFLMPAAAMAQVRQIPDGARRGSIVHIQGGIVEIDGQQMRLSVSAQIRSRDNLFIVPMSLPQGAPVKYTLDASGQIHRVWVLTPEELAAPQRKRE